LFQENARKLTNELAKQMRRALEDKPKPLIEE
jgi:hypothetical protein